MFFKLIFLEFEIVFLKLRTKKKEKLIHLCKYA